MSIYDKDAPPPPNIQTFSSLQDHIDRLLKFVIHLVEPREEHEVRARLDSLLPEGITTTVKQGMLLRRKVITIAVTGPRVDHLFDAGGPVNKYDTGPHRMDMRRRERDQREGTQTDVFVEDISMFCMQACS